MSELKIQSGLLEMTIVSVGGIEGKKPIPLSMKVVHVQETLTEYLNAWRREELNPAIKEFTGGEDTVLDKNVEEFMKLHKEMLEGEITVEVDIFTVEELSIDTLTISDFDMRLLRQVGLITE